MARSMTPQEAERLRELNSYEILDTPPEKDFDDLAAVAAEACGTPLSAITFIDSDRAWFKSKIGFSVPSIPAESAFCSTCIANPDEPFVVPDLTLDPRFADHPMVTGHPMLRFYAGVALVTDTNEAIGTLCVLDQTPRTLNEHQVYVLKTLARSVMNLLAIRRLRGEVQDAEERLRESETRFRAAIQGLQEGFVVQSQSGEIIYNNHAAESILGLTADQLHGRTSVDCTWRCVREDGSDFPGHEHPAMVSLRHGVAQSNVLMGVHLPDGGVRWISINSTPLFRVGEKTPYSVVVSFADLTHMRQRPESELNLRAAS